MIGTEMEMLERVEYRRGKKVRKINEEILRTDVFVSSQSVEKLIQIRSKCSCRYLWNYELHGLTSYLRSKTKRERILWLLIIISCVVLALYTTKLVFEQYLERQTATLITIQQKPRSSLPSIMICPKNPDALNYPMVLKDISKRLPHLDRITLGNLISFAIAGAGFHNMDPIIKLFPNETIHRLNALFIRWKGPRTLDDFFKELFEKMGYKCQDLFQACFYGYHSIPCCDIFRPFYMMLRGRCFRMANHYQTDPDVFGRISLYINQLPSRLIAFVGGMQPQVVLYISDKYPDVNNFPRYYLNFHDMLYYRIRGKKIVLRPENPQCTTDRRWRGRGACFVNKWLRTRVTDPFNCTLFYMKHKNPEMTTCKPELILNNYLMVNNIKMGSEKNRCLPDCSRIDYSLTIFKSESNIPQPIKRMPDFRVEISYVHLELDRYEEVRTLTLPGFVSQLGGQSGLFVGLSVCTLIQIILSTIRYIYFRTEHYRKYNHTFNFQYLR